MNCHFSLYLELLFLVLALLINCMYVTVCAEKRQGLLSSAQWYVKNWW